MAGCDSGCGADVVNVSGDPGYIRILWLVVAMNGGMFIFGTIASVFSGSVSVRADTLDFLGDAIATSIGLLLVGKTARVRATVSLCQGIALGLFGVIALVTALVRFFSGETPEAMQMGIYGILGLSVNLGAALLLLKYRHGDANVRAVWLYSRNDALGNIAVLAAAAAVAVTTSKIPDILAGTAIAFLFSHSAYEIGKRAVKERSSCS